MVVWVVAVAVLLAAVAYLALRRGGRKPKEEEATDSSVTSTAQLEEPAKVESKQSKKKKRRAEMERTSVPALTNKELEETYGESYYGSLSLRGKGISTITALTVKGSKVLLGNSRNELLLYDLRKWKLHTSCQEHFFTSLDNNSATAVAIGQQYYYAALDFEKTIVYFEFKGGEGGVYFREVRKFPRSIFKNNQGSMHVPDGERFIVTTGLESDTTINVWSMQGEKLASVGSYQIEHYDIKYTNALVMVRGWTSEIKVFQLGSDKEGGFAKIDKGFHLTLSEKPVAAVIDQLGLHAVAIANEGELIKLWTLADSLHPSEITADSCQIGLDQPKHCAIATLKMENERLHTVVLVASDSKMVLLDRFLKPIREFEGLSIESLHCFGASRRAVFGSYAGGRLAVWDLTKSALEQPEYVSA
jgi:hypothetical protein